LCEPLLCNWSEEAKRCSFQAARPDETRRRDFCGALPRALEGGQRSFCVDMPMALEAPLQAMRHPIEVERFFGCWYVLANIPTFVDAGSINNVERYEWAGEDQEKIKVTFSYETPSGKTKILKQKAVIDNEAKTHWLISPKVVFYLPIKLPYIIIDCDDDYSTTIVGYPDRSFLWIMARTPTVDEAVLDALIAKAVSQGYDAGKIVRVPQTWEKRGVSPDLCSN